MSEISTGEIKAWYFVLSQEIITTRKFLNGRSQIIAEVSIDS